MQPIKVGTHEKWIENKLGWAEPHSRFPLGSPMKFAWYESTLEFDFDPTAFTFYIFYMVLYAKAYNLSIPLFICWGHIHFKDLLNMIWPSRLKFKFEYDPMGGCIDIQLLIFEVVFHCRLSLIPG